MSYQTKKPITSFHSTYTYQPQRRGIAHYSPKPSRYRSKASVLLLISIIISVALFSHFTTHARQAPTAFSPALTSQLAHVIAEHPNDTVSVSLVDTTTGESAHVGTSVAFDAASTAKIIAACAYYHLVEAHEASLTTTLGAYSAQFQLQQMIQQSNNDSWHLITDAMGVGYLQSYAQSIGLHYTTSTNSLTSDDMAQLLAQLYSGKLLTSAHTAQLLSYMQQTNDETLIPAAVPSDVTVYHKYGLLDGVLHDASIIAKNGHAYSLVIYTKSADDSSDTKRTALIHSLTKIVTAAVF